ncbi:Sodium-dependent transporter [hydrothermal vent metagenome]|uniref:Sodium-dependent transporter n=1 Tax=hydrothermal vent metagenome TaxID=652676 RepID=A0A1W1ELG7_9ZZZZ
MKQIKSFISSYKLIIYALVIGLGFYLLALISFNEIQARLIGVIAFLVTLWTNNALHMGVVSILPIILFPILGLLEAKDVVTNYSKTTIFLFVGGFLLAIATEKSELHKRLATKLLSIFPNTPRGVLLSLMVTAGVLSSILSDTTTALLIIPIASFLTQNSDYKFRLLLGVAYASLIGGIITPVGTPPNLILMDFIESNRLEIIPFATWTAMMLPLAIIMMILACEILLWGFKKENFELVHIDITKKPLTTNQRKLIWILSTLALILALNPILKHFLGIVINEKLTLLTFGLFLFLPKVDLLEWQEDFAKIPFAIIFLFGAGFSIAMAFQKTELATEIANILVSFNYLPPILLMFIIGSGVVFATELTSNTALTSIMIPIIYPFAIKSGLDPILFMLIVAISASYAFMLPIATAPNAIAMSTGDIKTTQMIRRGIFLNIFGIVITFIVALRYWPLFLE